MIVSPNFFRGCVALAAFLTAACAYPINGAEDAYSVPERFPITVEPHMEIMRVAYSSGRIADASNADLQRFARDYMDNGSGAISVSGARRLPDAPIAVAERLVSLGVPASRIMLGSDEVNPSDDVKVSYIRYQAHAEACGDWSVNLGSTSANKPSPNFGCATQHNLAAMIADPRDLVSPRPLDPDDAQRRLTVLDKYRKGEATVAAKTQEQSGAVTQIGGGGGEK